MSFSRPSFTFVIHCSSAIICRDSSTASASPETISSSATSGVLILPTTKTGFFETDLKAREYSRSHPCSKVIGVWIHE